MAKLYLNIITLSSYLSPQQDNMQTKLFPLLLFYKFFHSYFFLL